MPILVDARIMYGFAIDYPGYEHGSDAWHQYIQQWGFQADPHNHMGSYDGLSILEMPKALSLPPTQNPPEIPTGTSTSHKITSQITGDTHQFDVYSPPAKETHAKWMLFFDGSSYQEFVPAYLERLMHGGMIQPHVVIFLNHQERQQELILNQDYSAFIVEELIPLVRKQYTISDNPEDVLIGGSSAGGLAALFTAFHHPNVFSKVLSQAGSFEVMS